jgi:hypothetical protein
MNVYWESGGIAPRILWPRHYMDVSGQLHAPADLLQGKSLWWPFYRRLCGLRSLSGYGDEEKNSQPLLGLEPPIIQPVDQRYTTELPRLLYKSKLNFPVNFSCRYPSTKFHRNAFHSFRDETCRWRRKRLPGYAFTPCKNVYKRSEVSHVSFSHLK